MCKRRISVVIPFVSKFSFSALEMASDPWCSFFVLTLRWHESHGSSLDQVVVGEEVARLCLFGTTSDVRQVLCTGGVIRSQWCLKSLFRSSCQFGSCTSLLRHQPQIWKSTAEISTGSPRVPGRVQFREAARTSLVAARGFAVTR